MPLYKTSVPQLDHNDAVELELVLDSFAGGENTIGADHELKNNEARIIENWDINSLGGMHRISGFTSVASLSNLIKPKVFTGVGLNDATSGGTYTDTVAATYTVIIDNAAANPDTFKWKKNSGSFTTGVAITGAAQTLSDGVTITFGATDGHTLNDQWVITVSIYTATPVDLNAFHWEGTTTESFVVAGGDLLKKSSATFALDHASDVGAFTSGTLCGYVSAADALWITNTADNLKRKVIGNAVAVPSSVPPVACERIYEHNFRLIAEGNNSKTIYGSRSGSGNWTSGTAWTASNDAWSITMPDTTTGAVPGFPSGNDIAAFTKQDTYVIQNQPSISRYRVNNGIGCWNGFTVARGNEGVYFFSTYPTLGVFLWDGVNFTNLTINHDFVDDVSLTNRMFGAYKDNRYYFIYNQTGSAVSYPNKMRIYDAAFGRWMDRPVNTVLSDNFGYPALQTKDNNEMFLGSAVKLTIYDNEDDSYSDNTNDTQANYKTKVFTSRDFSEFLVDNVRLKLLKATVDFTGTVGSFTIQWTADKGKNTGSQTYDITNSGDLINTTFTVNTSSILSTVPTRTLTKSFNNNAIGRDFDFQILNNDDTGFFEIRKIKIKAIALEEN